MLSVLCQSPLPSRSYVSGLTTVPFMTTTPQIRSTSQMSQRHEHVRGTPLMSLTRTETLSQIQNLPNPGRGKVSGPLTWASTCMRTLLTTRRSSTSKILLFIGQLFQCPMNCFKQWSLVFVFFCIWWHSNFELWGLNMLLSKEHAPYPVLFFFF